MNQVNRVSPGAVEFGSIHELEAGGNDTRIDAFPEAAWPMDERLEHYRKRAAQERAKVLRQMTRAVTRRVRAWREQRRAVAALERLDDQALRDIGVTRVDIESLRGGYITVDEFNTGRGFVSPGTMKKPARTQRAELRASAHPARVECPGPANAPAFGRAA